MIKFKSTIHDKGQPVMKNQETQQSVKKNIYSNIHKCPVNTLLTSIFSGIAWNG